MSIEQLLAKYKVQLPNHKDQSDDAEESSEFKLNIYTQCVKQFKILIFF